MAALPLRDAASPLRGKEKRDALACGSAWVESVRTDIRGTGVFGPALPLILNRCVRIFAKDEGRGNFGAALRLVECPEVMAAALLRGL